MASRLAAEQTGGLDLNAGGQEGESTDAAAEPASDPGGDGRGKCLADSDGGVSSPREAGDASCGGQNATMDVAADDDGVAAANEVTEAGAEVVGCGGAADVRGDLEIWVEKQNDVEDEVGSRSSVDGCQGDHKLECAAVEAGSTVVAAVETALTEEVATVPGRIEPVEFEKTRNEDETVEKFDSSVKKPYLEIDMMAGGNFGEGETATTEDEETQSSLVAANGSGGQGKAQMDVMEIDSVIGAARTTNAVHLDEVTVDRSHFLQDEAVVGEKDNHVENENRTELVEDDLSQKEKEESVKGAVDCDSIDEHLQDKLDVLDLSNDVDRSVDTSDGNDVVMSVDTSDPGAIQVGVSEISNQTEVKENQLSYQNGNKIVDGQLQPEVSASGSIVSELEKNSLDEEKLKAGFANPAYLSGCDSSMNVVGLEAGKPDGVADLGDIEVGVVESDRKELAGEVESSGGTRDQKRTQVDAMEIGIGNELPGHGLSIVKENQNLTIEAVDHPEVDKHLHESEGDLRPGDTDQNEELIVESSFVVDETEDILTVAINRYNESKELDREPEASRLSLLDNDGGRAFSEMPFASISQNIQDEENAIHEKELQKVDPLLVDRSKTNKISDDKRDSDLTDPKEVNASWETESQTFMEDVNLSVEISMPRTSESSQIENVPSGIESAHVVVTKKYNACKEDESPTTEFCQNVETGRNLEADQEFVLGKYTERVSPDAVWGKVKSHPWWPGQIFDPSDASDLALRHQKKDNFLVAYFGDKTFAWCDESQLKHFETYFSQMEKQSNSDVFVDAIDGALDEVARRMGLGMTCSCFPEAANATYSDQKVENAGIHEDSNGYNVDRSAILSYFQPGRLLEYVKALAKFPDCGTDRLELVMVNAQLKAFFRSKGYPELPSFKFISGLSENDAEISCSRSEGIMEVTIEQSGPIVSEMMFGKLKSRGRWSSMQKNVLEDGKKQKNLSELMEVECSQLANGANTEFGIKVDESDSLYFNKKRKATDSDSSDSEKGKKKRLDSLGDLQNKLPPLAVSSSFKIGECIRRVASQLTGAPPILKGHSEASLKNVSKDDSIFDVFISDGFSDVNMQSPRDKKENWEDYSSDEIEKKHPEKTGGRRGRKRKVDNQLAVLEMTELDHMQDSYWSDLISHNGPAKSKGEAQTRSQRKKRKSSGQTSSTLVLVPVLQGAEHIQVGKISPIIRQAAPIDRPIISVEEKMVDEFMPTALSLWTLKEAATEVQQKNNRVVVVFKRRADAEIAFSNAGKYSIFGPSLLSYRLRYFPSTPDAFPDSKQLDKTDALLVENSNLNTPANVHSSMSVASPDTGLRDKSDAVLVGSSSTNIPVDLHPSMSSSCLDTNPQDKSDAVPTENSSANDPSDLHPSISDAYTDTNLLDKNGAAVLEYSDHPLMSDGSPDTNLHEKVMQCPQRIAALIIPVTFIHQHQSTRKSDAVLTEDSSANNPSDFHPSVSDAYLDANLLDKNDAAVLEHSNISLPCDLHPLVSDGSSDANLQDTSDANVQDTSDAMPTENSSTNNPSYLHPPMPYLDTNLRDKNDAAVLEHSNTSLPSDLHPPMSDGSLDVNLEDNRDVILTENSDIPSHSKPSTSNASLETNLQDESSNTCVATNPYPSMCNTSPDISLQDKSDITNVAVDGSLNKPEDKGNAHVEDSSINISAQAEREIVQDASEVTSEKPVATVTDVDGQAG
ncbi:PWWP domain [Musa troglodytarum]|uniref:PWWP domain n=1 Tax=Musa troglodytarum TaxID=320322 RepID=A0A9E7FYI3_9LILI|nr:PWWP domain [Musa troglodytarum]